MSLFLQTNPRGVEKLLLLSESILSDLKDFDRNYFYNTILELLHSINTTALFSSDFADNRKLQNHDLEINVTSLNEIINGGKTSELRYGKSYKMIRAGDTITFNSATDVVVVTVTDVRVYSSLEQVFDCEISIDALNPSMDSATQKRFIREIYEQKNIDLASQENPIYIFSIQVDEDKILKFDQSRIGLKSSSIDYSGFGSYLISRSKLVDLFDDIISDGAVDEPELEAFYQYICQQDSLLGENISEEELSFLVNLLDRFDSLKRNEKWQTIREEAILNYVRSSLWLNLDEEGRTVALEVFSEDVAREILTTYENFQSRQNGSLNVF
jgi:ASC-1-like (ASCH) protein